MTTTGACLAIGAIVLVIAAPIGAVRLFLHRAARLERVPGDHDEAEALLADLDLPYGGAGCGCFWQYLPGGHIRLYTCDAHGFIFTPDGEA